MTEHHTDKARFGPLTVVDSRGARRNQASNIVYDILVFGTSLLPQTNGTLYRALAEHKIRSLDMSVMCGTP